jgi:hypothetical protein
MHGRATFDAEPIRRCATAAAGPCHHGLYTSAADRHSCKLNVLGSIPSGGSGNGKGFLTRGPEAAVAN